MRLVNAEPSETYAYLYEHLDDNGIIAAQNAIDDMPTIDAVEVVRCKECKHFKEYTDILTGRKAYYCKYKDGHFTGSEMHYCSYGENGERRE